MPDAGKLIGVLGAVVERRGQHVVVTKPQHRADMFMDLDADPREGGTSLGDERATLGEFLRCQRLTLQLKCQGLERVSYVVSQMMMLRRTAPPRKVRASLS